MAGSRQRETSSPLGLARADVGSALSIAGGLSFLFLCMILPLVGKAGAQTPHYTKNFIAFLMVLLVTLALSGLAVKSKLERRKVDGSPFPRFSAAIFGATAFLLIALVLGLLKI
ncbi:MAG TPA: hypothetical protein PKE26_07060 [Kiritimatiellia bacterium]|nr:hypothetical protein [Kiritimatiellia bacterium]HMO98850.1 hypothetical protein [Kiritimatiellia bacterium]HMP96203.1 hypothetical protein [Kiritimatiellia bacterium]